MNTGIIILAAGNSSRLGTAKQLLRFQGKTLLDIAIDAAIQSSLQPALVVLGAYEISSDHHNENIRYVTNDKWHEGMSSSIAYGMTGLLSMSPEVENVIIAVSDQPYIDSEIFIGLKNKKQQSDKSIIASQYGQTRGTPVLFNKKYFSQLITLTGDKGAKKLLKLHPGDIDTIPFALGHIDIDTETDYHNLINHK